ncbi:hypothetical protein F5Y04DRAFT_289290 [Hypomontagnella monticulosa]|nr:hypothetical protein F5Y04DRAFT_289290 [Hypomontagnella monticulosa]
MSKPVCPATRLKDEPSFFGRFNQCLTFRSQIQLTTSSHANPTDPLSLPSNTEMLISEQDVYTYLDDLYQKNSMKAQPGVCILAFTNLANENNGKLPLPVSKDLFERIVQDFNISTAFLNIFDTGLATYTSTIPSSSREDIDESENAQFIIQQNRAYSAFSIGLTFDIRTGKCRVLLFGAEAKAVSELFQRLNSMSPGSCGPMEIPAIAMELQARGFTATIKNCQNRVHSIEIATGMRQFNFSFEKRGTSPEDWKTLDLISITRDLSSFLSRFAFLKLQAETGVYLIERMTRTTEVLIERIRGEEHRVDTNGLYNTISKFDEIRSWYLGMAARCRYLIERTTAQSQTVHCLIVSQYNLTNIDIARRSRDIAEETRKENETMRAIAELSRRDGDLMIQIAKDSRTVAIETARDSAAMQVIATVTVLFLPATFTATFFSMTFFDFLGAERPRISPWSWIYVVVTATLTVLIRLSWATMWKKKKEKITRGIHGDLGALGGP